MRIGLISSYPPLECGIGTYSQYLTDALRHLHSDVFVVCHHGGAGPRVFPSFDYDDADLAERACRVMLRFTPDAVHLQHEYGLYGRHFGVAAVPLLIQLRLAGIPTVTTLHSVYEDVSETHRPILESILASSDHVIVHEPYQRETLRQTFGERLGERVSVIPHGARELEPPSQLEARRRLGLPEDRKLMLLIGYMRPSKNFELMIDLWPRILRRCPDAALVLAGKMRGGEHREYRDMLMRRMSESPARQEMYLVRSQLPQESFDLVLAAADAVALPYRMVSQSGILAHALAFGRPVIGSDSPAMRRTLEESGAGIVCRTEDDFVDATARLLADESLHRWMAEGARRYVRDRIGWSRIARQHLEVYHRLTEIPASTDRVIEID